MKKFAAILLGFALILGGCAGTQGQNTEQGSQAKDKLEAIKESGKIVMYTNAEFPPFEFFENNEIIGVDVEIGLAIAEKLGVTLEIMNAEFGGIVASIASGKGDMAISGITIREDRLEQVDFSVPYVDSIQYIIVAEDSDLQYVEDFSGEGLGVQLGTTGAMLIEDEINGEEGVLYNQGASLRTYNSAPAAMQDLKSGRIAAVVIDELVAIAVAAENPGYKAIPLKFLSGDPLTEQFGVAIQKGNEDLLAVINEVITEMLAEGKIDEAIEKYAYAE